MDIDIPDDVCYRIAQYVPDKSTLDINFHITKEQIYTSVDGLKLTIELMSGKISTYKHIIIGIIKDKRYENKQEFIQAHSKVDITKLINILSEDNVKVMIGIACTSKFTIPKVDFDDDYVTVYYHYDIKKESKSFITFQTKYGLLLEKYEINKDKLIKTLLEISDKL